MRRDPDIDALVAQRLIELASCLVRSPDVSPEGQATALLRKIVHASGEARATAIEEAERFLNYRPVLKATPAHFMGKTVPTTLHSASCRADTP